jgi:hypothetical protein
MDVFISWSERRSEWMAENLAKHLPLMLQGVDVFMSQASIEPGLRWRVELGEWLDKSNYGVICVTPENLTKPWLLFEAGALSKKLDARVCCLLIDGLEHSQLPDPLKQFMNCHFQRERMLDLFHAINRHQDRPLGGSQVHDVFEKWWPDLEAGYRVAVEEPYEKVDVPEQRPSDKLDEVLRILRAQERDKVARKLPRRSDATEQESLAPNLIDALSKDNRNTVRQALKMAARRGIAPSDKEMASILAYIEACEAADWRSAGRNLLMGDEEYNHCLRACGIVP